MPRLAPTGTTLMLLQEEQREEGRVTGSRARSLPSPFWACIRAFTLSLSNHRVSAAELSSGARGVPP